MWPQVYYAKLSELYITELYVGISNLCNINDSFSFTSSNIYAPATK